MNSRLLQESNLAARQPRRAPHHVIQATTNEGLAQGPYVTARVVFEPATFRTEGTEYHHSATTALVPLEYFKQHLQCICGTWWRLG